MTNYRVPAEQIVENILKLTEWNEFEEIVMPRLTAYLRWATGDDAYFNDDDNAEYHRNFLKDAQDYLSSHS